MLELLYLYAYIRGVGKTFDFGGGVGERGGGTVFNKINRIDRVGMAQTDILGGGTLQAGHIFHSFLVCLHNMFIVPYIATVLVLLLHILGGRMKDSTGC